MSFLEQHLTIDQAARSMRAGDLDQAEVICRRLLKQNKRNLDAIEMRGAIAVKRRSYAEALKDYRKCLSAKPREAHYHVAVGKLEALMGRFDDAIARFDKALRLKPGDEQAAEWMATVSEWNGDYDTARTILEPFVAAGTENATMAEVQAKVAMHAGRDAEACAILKRHLPDPGMAALLRHRLGHVLGLACEKLGEFDLAFEAHTAANRAVAVSFDRADYVRSIDRIIAVFSAEALARLPRPSTRSELPVFITGMPRSGTTLVEQIIDAHPLGHGAGEIREIDQMVAGLAIEIDSGVPYPECFNDLTGADAERLARRYLDHIGRLSRSAKRIVNKSLENSRNLWFIAVLFPAARIIHCHRDPVATCLSCYMSDIMPAAHPYISDLGDIGLAYRQYERLTSHWREVLDVPILDVGYEELVEDLPGTARRIIEFCGLEWDDRCLRFHESGRAVMTLSYDQVRRPIYRTSIHRHRNYERHLGPLMDALSTDAS